MLNARIVKITEKNADSGKVSLQKSDLVDFIEGNLKALIVVHEGQEVCDGNFYFGTELNLLMARALENGPIYHRESGDTFFLATL